MPPTAPVRAALFGASAVAVGVAINEANGTLTPAALKLIGVAVAAALAALLLPRDDRDGAPAFRGSWIVVLLVAELAYEVGFLLTTPPVIYGRLPPDDSRVFYRALAALAVFFGSLVFAPPRVRAMAVPALIAVHGALALWMLRVSPAPPIDVFYFQRDSCVALLHGKNPYEITFPNIYGDTTPFYGAHMSVRGRLQFGFVYPPLSLLMALPGHLLGDCRYSQVAATEIAAALMTYLRRDALGVAAAAIFLLTPRAFFVLEQSWTEPYAVLLLVATVFAAIRFPRALPYVLGLFLCVKQYMVFALVPSLFLVPWSDARALRRFVVKTLLTACAVTLPLALWSFHAFWRDVVALQTLQPLRTDALSYLVWFSRNRPTPLPLAVCFAVTGAVTLAALWRFPRTPAGFVSAIAVVFLAFFALNKQAFANYYFFVIGAFCCAIAARGGLAPSRSAY